MAKDSMPMGQQVAPGRQEAEGVDMPFTIQEVQRPMEAPGRPGGQLLKRFSDVSKAQERSDKEQRDQMHQMQNWQEMQEEQQEASINADGRRPVNDAIEMSFQQRGDGQMQSHRLSENINFNDIDEYQMVAYEQQSKAQHVEGHVKTA